MAKPTSPSWPHRSRKKPELHVDLRGAKKKQSVKVKNPLGALPISGGGD